MGEGGDGWEDLYFRLWVILIRRACRIVSSGQMSTTILAPRTKLVPHLLEIVSDKLDAYPMIVGQSLFWPGESPETRNEDDRGECQHDTHKSQALIQLGNSCGFSCRLTYTRKVVVDKIQEGYGEQEI